MIDWLKRLNLLLFFHISSFDDQGCFSPPWKINFVAGLNLNKFIKWPSILSFLCEVLISQLLTFEVWINFLKLCWRKFVQKYFFCDFTQVFLSNFFERVKFLMNFSLKIKAKRYKNERILPTSHLKTLPDNFQTKGPNERFPFDAVRFDIVNK